MAGGWGGSGGSGGGGGWDAWGGGGGTGGSTGGGWGGGGGSGWGGSGGGSWDAWGGSGGGGGGGGWGTGGGGSSSGGGGWDAWGGGGGGWGGGGGGGGGPEKKIESIRAAYHPKSPFNRFQFFFYNSVNSKDVGAFQKPEQADQQLWEQARRNNPDPEHLVPCLAVGFEDLEKRIQQQRRAAAVRQEQLQSVQRSLVQMKTKHEETKVEIAALRKREMALSHRLLQAMRALEVAQARGAPLRNEEVEFRKQLLRMRAELAKPTQFQAKLNELASMARMQGDRAGDAVAQLDRVALVRVREVLDLQQSELEQLTRVLKKDAEDVAVVQQGQADAAPRG